MTDAADTKPSNGAGATPGLTAEQSEQLRASMIDAITAQAQQLLALVGIGVPTDQLRVHAERQLELQQGLLAQVGAVLEGQAAEDYPIFGARFVRKPTSALVLPGQPTSTQGEVFPIAGPKRLAPNDPVANVVGSLSALAYLLHPHLRLVAHVFGIQIEFAQFPPLQVKAPRKPFDGKFKGPAR